MGVRSALVFLWALTHLSVFGLLCICQNNVHCPEGRTTCEVTSLGSKCFSQQFRHFNSTEVYFRRLCIKAHEAVLRCRFSPDRYCCDTDNCNAPPVIPPSPRTTNSSCLSNNASNEESASGNFSQNSNSTDATNCSVVQPESRTAQRPRPAAITQMASPVETEATTVTSKGVRPSTGNPDSSPPAPSLKPPIERIRCNDQGKNRQGRPCDGTLVKPNYLNTKRPVSFLTAKPYATGKVETSRNYVMVVAVIVGTLCGCIFLVTTIVILIVFKFRRQPGRSEVEINVDVPVTINYGAPLGDLTMTGSGAGLPMLAQTTIARQTTLVEHIGCGRYGNVWRGRWMDQDVAVKVFASIDEQSWAREVEIYQTAMLRHQNILGFIAADNNDSGTWTQLWLVTDYCEFGSLFDFLCQNAVDSNTMIKLAESAAGGLAHLHLAVQGLQGKPAIAHRDIKSRNYLVKKDCSCCLGDFGLAVTHDVVSDRLNIPKTTKVGTIRYMAPEMLNETMNYGSFEAYKKADIYSLALVMWEIASRCHGETFSEEYAKPYEDVVNADPSFEEMAAVAASKSIRPNIPKIWENDKQRKVMAELIDECWSESPSARLPALRIKKTLANVKADYGESVKSTF